MGHNSIDRCDPNRDNTHPASENPNCLWVSSANVALDDTVDVTTRQTDHSTLGGVGGPTLGPTSPTSEGAPHLPGSRKVTLEFQVQTHDPRCRTPGAILLRRRTRFPGDPVSFPEPGPTLSSPRRPRPLRPHLPTRQPALVIRRHPPPTLPDQVVPPTSPREHEDRSLSVYDRDGEW